MDQEKIREVISATGCDEKLAHIILEFTDGVVENACKIIFAIPKDIVVIMSRFQVNRAQKNGLLVMAYDIRKKKIERISSLVSSDKAMCDAIQENDVNLLFKMIDDAQQKMAVADMTEAKDLLSLLKKDDSIEKLRDLIDDNGKVEETLFISWLNDVLFRTFADSNLTIKVVAKLVDSFQLNRGEKEIKSEEKEKSETVEKKEERDTGEEVQKAEYRNDSVIIFSSQPVISPVKGTPIPKFKVGDEVFAEIADPREIGSYLKKLLQEASSKEHPEYEGRVAAVIEEMEYSTNTDNVSLIVKYGPGIYGRLLVPRDLKIEGPGKVNMMAEEVKPGSSGWLIWVAAMAFIFLIILMAIIKK